MQTTGIEYCKQLNSPNCIDPSAIGLSFNENFSKIQKRYIISICRVVEVAETIFHLFRKMSCSNKFGKQWTEHKQQTPVGHPRPFRIENFFILFLGEK